MAAQAIITLARASETLRVPQSAIIESAGKHFLYKLAGGRALRQEVKLGAREGDEVVVEQGVSASELVIVDNLHSLKPASRVRALVGAPGS
jgi:membrane fusion protein (multidrug efflux system)